MTIAETRVLVLSDNGSDAEMVRRLLHVEYPKTQVSTDPERLVADFDRLRPQVLMLAFKAPDAALRCCERLYLSSNLGNAQAFRTVLLCDKNELNRAFELCRADKFDDYVLFWPLVHDAPRLTMAVHVAVRALEAAASSVPLGALAVQARRIAELETLLEQQLAQGRAHAEQARDAVELAQAWVGDAINDLTDRILESGLGDAVDVRDPALLRQEMGKLRDSAALPPLGEAAAALQPMQHWLDAVRIELAAPLQAAREIVAQVGNVRPRLLVVDDDAFQRKLLGQVLGAAKYDVEAASGAAEALSVIRKRRPDLILMDVQMPGTGGIAITRRLKAAEAFASIPVIMLTGQSEKQVIVDSLAAGACDFVVKPFDREILLKKVARYLAG